MLKEVERICAAIPHDQLAIQWDNCIEMHIWDGQSPTMQWVLGGDPLRALSGLFRMAHAFITLRRLDQAEHVAATGTEALAPVAST